MEAATGDGVSPPGERASRLSFAANGIYGVGLWVTVIAGDPDHIFRITGTVNGNNVGEVEICVTAPITPTTVTPPKPDPYVQGGYQSADVVWLTIATKRLTRTQVDF